MQSQQEGVQYWPGLKPRPTSNLELGFKAILIFSPSPKVVISILDRSVIRLLSLINISSKRPTPTSTGSPSTRPPTQQFRLLPVPPPLAIGRLPPFIQSLSISTVINLPPVYSSQLNMQLNYSTPHISQRAAYFTTGELNKILSNPVATKEHDNKEVRRFYLPPEQNIVRAPQRVGAAPPILRTQSYAKRS